MNSRKKIILIVIISIVILGIIFLTYLSKKDNNPDNNKDTDISSNEKNNDMISRRKTIDMDNEENVSIKDGTKYNDSEKIEEEHYVENGDGVNKDIVISDINLFGVEKDGKTYFTAKITNNGNEDYNSLILFLDFYDKDEKMIYSQEYHVKNLKKNTSQNIELERREDFSNAYDVKILY